MQERRTTSVSTASDKISELEDQFHTLKNEEAELLEKLKKNRELQQLIEEGREEITSGRDPEEVAIDNLIEACKDDLKRKDLVKTIKECRELNINNDLISALLFIFNMSVPDIEIDSIVELDIKNEKDKVVIGDLYPYINEETKNAIAIVNSKAPFLVKLRIKAIERILEPFLKMRKKYELMQEKEEKMLLDYYSSAKKAA